MVTGQGYGFGVMVMV